MTIITGILILLCTLANSFTMRAQEDSVRLAASCVPVKDISRTGLAFQAGENQPHPLPYPKSHKNSHQALNFPHTHQVGMMLFGMGHTAPSLKYLGSL